MEERIWNTRLTGNDNCCVGTQFVGDSSCFLLRLSARNHKAFNRTPHMSDPTTVLNKETVVLPNVIIDPSLFNKFRKNDNGFLIDDYAARAKVLANHIFRVFFPELAPEHHIGAKFPSKLLIRSGGPRCINTLVGDSIIVELNLAAPTTWFQFSYQLAHEFLHAITHFGLIPRNVNDHVCHWLEEAFAETASRFIREQLVLLGDRTNFQVVQPYPWMDYSQASQYQADNDLLESEFAKTFKEWLCRPTPRPGMPADLTNLDFMRKHSQPKDISLPAGWKGGERPENGTVACLLLPIVKKHFTKSSANPWAAMLYLRPPANEPIRDDSVKDYIESWRKRAPSNCRAFIQEVASLF